MDLSQSSSDKSVMEISRKKGRDQVGGICDALLHRIKSDDYCGYDPYDALNSSLFSTLGGMRLRMARIAWQQLHRRSPINLRALCAIEKARNPKGIALMVLGLIERFEQRRSNADLDEAIRLGDWLLSQRANPQAWPHSAWGYNFHWAARAFDVPRGKPNAITTCYVARALLALWRVTGERRFVESALDAGKFLQTLYMVQEEGVFYRYVPGESVMVHNANLWSAAIVALTASHVGDGAACEQALLAARHSAHAQGADGAWRYGERSHHGFVDGFHTGYNLEALSTLQGALATREFEQVVERGMGFYRQAFFEPNGDVKYYASRTYPLDMHSVAQAVITLLRVGGSDEDHELARRVIHRAIERLYLRSRERFVYRQGRYFSNQVNYMRWTQAWAFYALSLYGADAERRTRVAQ
ncbi:aspartate-semialdehyde dehydrogenase [Paraburkholderia sp. CNPSo 3076]|uniref:aspartate-semialdehyde dehydrogenase n=1 Tax=Paraburkholderia sp. CNPSo 3076 TaxID=2940936 RepID=UPI00224EE6FA|nr:aspartate-semialdehyde dehydrogenase [Paraburkholderia sp. CNPSo 3076]MCX5544999.1 aspartate-semialdehyde dehydrogenase [Paraburkholderia sp. CNPSo 3076]